MFERQAIAPSPLCAGHRLRQVASGTVLVALDPAAPAVDDEAMLGPGHRTLLVLCRIERQSVVELAAGADLPVRVVRVLPGDLLDRGWVIVSPPGSLGPPAGRADSVRSPKDCERCR